MQLIKLLLSFMLFSIATVFCGSTFGLGNVDVGEVHESQGSHMVPVTFEGYVGNHYFNGTGSVEEIFAQLELAHPDFNRTIVAENGRAIDGMDRVVERDEAGLDIQERGNIGMICCPVPGQPWESCNRYYVENNLYYLKSFTGNFGLEAGPGRCGRISCSYNAGIHWCNDNPYPISIPVYDIFLSGIKLSATCNPERRSVCGQAFESGGWNVFITGERC